MEAENQASFEGSAEGDREYQVTITGVLTGLHLLGELYGQLMEKRPLVSSGPSKEPA